MSRVVDKVIMKDFNLGNVISKGTVSDDGKFLVSARVRGIRDAKFGERKENGVATKLINRIDVSVSFWDDIKHEQGPFIIDYMSGRVMLTNTLTGEESLFQAFQCDNENSRVQFKNMVLGDTIFNTIKQEVERAQGDYINGIATVSRTSIKFADQLIKKAAELEAKKAPVAESTSVEDSTAAEMTEGA